MFRSEEDNRDTIYQGTRLGRAIKSLDGSRVDPPSDYLASAGRGCISVSMKKNQRAPRAVANYTLRNKDTGWYRHAEGGHDTEDPGEAVVLGKAEAERWRRTMREYEAIPLSEACPI